MLQAMYNGVSAISATQQDMDVIGNNISNVNTTSFKDSEVTFADQLSQTLQGASSATNSIGGTNPLQTGTGVKIASISPNMSQGSLLSTSSPTDLAIQGNGFFMLANPATGISYSRDGHFAIDNSGNLVDATTGEFVLGWSANSQGQISTGSAITPASTLKIAIGQTQAVQGTSNVSFTGNLSADTQVDPGSGSTANQFTTTETVYDSLGEPHAITLTFTRQDDGTSGVPSNTWNWAASGTGIATPTAGTDASSGPPAVAATASVNEGSVTFGSDGTFSSAGSVDSTGATIAGVAPSVALTNTNGSGTPQSISLNFSGASQVSGASTFAPEGQNGYASGSLSSFTIDQNGVITGAFTNGLTRALGQIAMSNFSNPEGLSQLGNNEYAPTVNSGQPLTGTANTLGLGSISTGYLEQSNVDLGTELTNMIVAQRAFEANTKIVTAVDQMLSDLNQMIQ